MKSMVMKGLKMAKGSHEHNDKDVLFVQKYHMTQQIPFHS
jgi:hypothetical protein